MKVLAAIEPAHDASIAKTIESNPAFLDEMPRGRGLAASHKTTLRRIGKHASDYVAGKQPEIEQQLDRLVAGRGDGLFLGRG